MDVFTIQRGDEGPVQSADHFMSQLVGFVFHPLDRINQVTAVMVVCPEQLLQQPRRLDRQLGHGREQVEETLIPGEQPHRGPR